MKTLNELEVIKPLFLQKIYDTNNYPASVANVMFARTLVWLYLADGGSMYDNVKVYIKWIRLVRDKLFPNNQYNKGRKFVQIFGIKRTMTTVEAFNYMGYKI